MNNSLVMALTFLLGGTCGYFLAKMGLEQKYKQIADEEIKSATESLNNYLMKKGEKKAKDILEETKIEDSMLVVNPSKEERTAYNHMTKGYKSKEAPADITGAEHFVIDPADFGALAGFDTLSLTYYANGVLCNEDDEEMSDEEIDEYIGLGFEKHFGEYERDAVHIRNTRLKIDYEILAVEEDKK